jgi:hypothetical protein
MTPREEGVKKQTNSNVRPADVLERHSLLKLLSWLVQVNAGLSAEVYRVNLRKLWIGGRYFDLVHLGWGSCGAFPAAPISHSSRLASWLSGVRRTVSSRMPNHLRFGEAAGDGVRGIEHIDCEPRSAVASNSDTDGPASCAGPSGWNGQLANCHFSASM